MPELIKDDELIIDDELTRSLLIALLAKWGDPQAKAIVSWVKKHIDDCISLGDARLLSKYPRQIYNKATSRKTLETFSELLTAHEKLVAEAELIFESCLGEAIKRTLLNTILELANHAANTPIDRIGKEAETSLKLDSKKWRRTTGRYLREAIGIARPFGSPVKYPKELIERRSIAIIRVLNAGKRDKSKVALLFYSDFDESMPADRAKLLKKYLNSSVEERKAHLRRYNELLRGKFTFEELLVKGTEKSDGPDEENEFPVP